MGFTDYALDKFVAQEISTAAIHVDSLAGELSGYEGWLNQFVMRRIFHAHVSDDRAALAFIMVRKAVAALAEWESMRATAALGVRRPSVYFETLRHCENCIAACSQGVEFGRRALGIELFSKGDGSEFQRLNAIYNRGRHFHPVELPPGDLHAVWVPDAADEAVRDLSRLREDAVKACTLAKQQLGGFLLRRDLRYEGKTAWTKTYFAWLASIKFDADAAQVTLTEYLLAVQAAIARVQRLDQALARCIVGWRFESVVAALQALRGVALVTAVGLVAEIGDLSRFAHPRQLMSYLGLVPSEHSSGERVRRGSITKTGNSHARRLLTEAAWCYRHPARIGPDALRRQNQLSQPVRDIAWKAQLRLTSRFASLNSRGMQPNKACVAIARELAGFVWAVGMQALRDKPIPT